MSDASRARRSAVVARHGRQRGRGPWRTLLAIVASVLSIAVIAGASVTAYAVFSVTSNLDIVDIGGDEVEVPTIGAYPGGYNILIAGSDTRVGQGGLGGSEADDSGVLNDVNIMLHVSADHTRATAISFPRDLMVEIPSCTDANGDVTQARSLAQINTALGIGGLGCVVTTIENLTGLDIQFAGLITFRGVVEMSNAVGGVDVCITAPIDDPLADLYLPEAGNVTLQGEQALAFLRSRHGVGDGSDLGRISSQQVYLSSLVRKLQADGTLGNPITVYNLANAALSNMTLSSSMASVDTMAALAFALKDIPLDNVVFTQYPNVYGTGQYAARVFPDEELAEQLMGVIARDEAFQLGESGDNVGSVDTGAGEETATPDPNTTGTPTPGATDTPVPTETQGPTVIDGLSGQTAAQQTCSVAQE